MAGILGRKVGMTRITLDTGVIIPVTLIEAAPNTVVQIKTSAKDGYQAISLGYKPLKKPSKSKRFSFVREFKVGNTEEFKLEQQIDVKSFQESAVVNIQSISKGKGFQGVIKRHGFSEGPKTHGSHHHREPGSAGSLKPFSIKRGKRYPGRTGNKTITLRNIPVIKVDADRNLLALKGPIPGSTNSLVKIWTV